MDALRTSRVVFGDPYRNKPFQQRSHDLFDEPQKEEQRSKVLGFLVSEHRSNRVRYLGFPGEHWLTERRLYDTLCTDGMRFRGIEASWSILERSVPWMPGRKAEYFSDKLSIGTFCGFRTTKSVIVYAHASSWFSIQGNDHSYFGKTQKKHKRAKFRFHRTYNNNTMIWLDFTSNLCLETKRTLRHVFSQCDPRIKTVPIAITIYYGRDSGITGGIDMREKYIAACLNANKSRQYVPASRWLYESSQGGTMATFTGLLELI